MPGTFSPPPLVSDPDMHHGTCVTHVPWCMSGSLTCGFLWSRWRGKRSRHSRRMRNTHFYVSGKRPVGEQNKLPYWLIVNGSWCPRLAHNDAWYSQRHCWTWRRTAGDLYLGKKTTTGISNHINCNMRTEIIYPFPNFNGETVEVCECIRNCIPHFIEHVIDESTSKRRPFRFSVIHCRCAEKYKNPNVIYSMK